MILILLFQTAIVTSLSVIGGARADIIPLENKGNSVYLRQVRKEFGKPLLRKGKVVVGRELNKKKEQKTNSESDDGDSQETNAEDDDENNQEIAQELLDVLDKSNAYDSNPGLSVSGDDEGKEQQSEDTLQQLNTILDKDESSEGKDQESLDIVDLDPQAKKDAKTRNSNTTNKKASKGANTNGGFNTSEGVDKGKNKISKEESSNNEITEGSDNTHKGILGLDESNEVNNQESLDIVDLDPQAKIYEDEEQDPSQMKLAAQATMKGDSIEEETKSIRLQRISNFTANTSFNASSITFSACEKLDMAIEFMTSLDFQEHFQNVYAYTNPYDPKVLEYESEIYNDVYVLQVVFTPIFLALLLFGAKLYSLTFVICAAAIGLFTVFDGVEALLSIQIGCPMKLILSITASIICALLAVTFFRIGLYSFGCLTFGVAAYVVFDSFPQLDPGESTLLTDASNIVANVNGQTLMLTSDLSNTAWMITAIFSAMGGILLRYFEMSQMEFTTAALGGIGIAYSFHTFLLIHRFLLDPWMVFLLAFFISAFGWRFQRKRRYIGVLPQRHTLNGKPIPWHPIEQQKQLEESMISLLNTQKAESEQQKQLEESMISLLNRQKEESEHISKLTLTVNRFVDAFDGGKELPKKEKEKV